LSVGLEVVFVLITLAGLALGAAALVGLARQLRLRVHR
jgi:hypothetical protein